MWVWETNKRQAGGVQFEPLWTFSLPALAIPGQLDHIIGGTKATKGLIHQLKQEPTYWHAMNKAVTGTMKLIGAVTDAQAWTFIVEHYFYNGAILVEPSS